MDNDFRRKMKGLSDKGREDNLDNQNQSREELRKSIEIEVRQRIITSGEIIPEEEIVKRVDDEIWERETVFVKVIAVIVVLLVLLYNMFLNPDFLFKINL